MTTPAPTPTEFRVHGEWSQAAISAIARLLIRARETGTGSGAGGGESGASRDEDREGECHDRQNGHPDPRNVGVAHCVESSTAVDLKRRRDMGRSGGPK